jgi:double-stranded uracil-DNA glycosylase
LDEIRRLLREKGIADRDRQKAIRGQLRRRFGFYISDFTDRADGFTASDLDTLVARATAEIADDPDLGGVFETQAPSEAITEERSEEAEVLPDVLGPNPRIIFCGTAVGDTSARADAYYAGRGNQFWSVLARVGLTPRVLQPWEFRELARYGIGLSDLAKFISGPDVRVGRSEFDVEGFRRKITNARPQAIGFNGKRAAETFLERSVDYGCQTEQIGDTAVFVLPSTSGAARGYWDEGYWCEIAEFVQQPGSAPSRA